MNEWKSALKRWMENQLRQVDRERDTNETERAQKERQKKQIHPKNKDQFKLSLMDKLVNWVNKLVPLFIMRKYLVIQIEFKTSWFGSDGDNVG